MYVAITRAKDKVILTAAKGKGYDLDILTPGLDAAGIVAQEIPFNYDDAIAPSPGDPPPFALPTTVSIEPVKIGVRGNPGDRPDDLRALPRQFEYQVVEVIREYRMSMLGLVRSVR
ncbi:MAG: hypothetical protein IPP63_18410 [Chloracidobacterium sp.]|nr:hypothetical protein [Chloracidobacterium sp.]